LQKISASSSPTSPKSLAKAKSLLKKLSITYSHTSAWESEATTKKIIKSAKISP
jgi:hypothetical protein